MRKYVLIPLAIVWSLAGIAFVAAAGSEADFKSALAAAEGANKEAGALKNQWTTTAQALAAAKQAAAAGDFDKASQSRQAGRGARESVDCSGQGAAGSLESGRDSLSGPASGRAFA